MHVGQLSRAKCQLAHTCLDFFLRGAFFAAGPFFSAACGALAQECDRRRSCMRCKCGWTAGTSKAPAGTHLLGLFCIHLFEPLRNDLPHRWQRLRFLCRHRLLQCCQDTAHSAFCVESNLSLSWDYLCASRQSSRWHLIKTLARMCIGCSYSPKTRNGCSRLSAVAPPRLLAAA